MTKLRSVAIAVVFLMGCAVGGAASRFVVPPASAQQQAAGLTRWEYTCVEEIGAEGTAAKSNRLGAEGWEMTVAGYSKGTGPTWCFKRALR